MADLKWKAPTVAYTDAITGADMNSQANENIQVSSITIDNETNLTLFMDLELTLASLDLSAQTNPAVYIYMLESIDGGTDFDTSTDNTITEALMPPANKIKAIMSVRAGSGAEAKLAVETMIPVPPGQWKLAPRNKTGAALAASGNTLKYRLYMRQG